MGEAIDDSAKHQRSQIPAEVVEPLPQDCEPFRSVLMPRFQAFGMSGQHEFQISLLLQPGRFGLAQQIGGTTSIAKSFDGPLPE